MATLAFRQGIVGYQTDLSNAPNFLQKVSGGTYINLNVSPTPTTFTIAHFDQNYLFIEQKSVTHAWGPFSGSTTQWLYWDVDFITGEITRGSTIQDPVSQATAPTSPALDKHWFDTANKIMKVWSGTAWIEKLRVFAAKYLNSTTIVYYPLGSQVGISTGSHAAGYPLFDDSGLPVQKFSRNRRGQFIHTESPLASQFSQTANFRIEGSLLQAEAVEYIPKFSVVAFKQTHKIGICTNVDSQYTAVGVVSEDINSGEVRTVITNGPVYNEDWNWTVPVMSPLFVGSDGFLTTTPPSVISLQHVGYVTGQQSVVINIQPQIKLTTFPGNYITTSLDLNTGIYVGRAGGGGGGGGMSNVQSFTFYQPTPLTTWNVHHGGATVNVSVQIYDSSNKQIIPADIQIIDQDNVTVSFGTSSPASGKAQLVLMY